MLNSFDGRHSTAVGRKAVVMEVQQETIYQRLEVARDRVRRYARWASDSPSNESEGALQAACENLEDVLREYEHHQFCQDHAIPKRREP